VRNEDELVKMEELRGEKGESQGKSGGGER